MISWLFGKDFVNSQTIAKLTIWHKIDHILRSRAVSDLYLWKGKQLPVKWLCKRIQCAVFKIRQHSPWQECFTAKVSVCEPTAIWHIVYVTKFIRALQKTWKRVAPCSIPLCRWCLTPAWQDLHSTRPTIERVLCGVLWYTSIGISVR